MAKSKKAPEVKEKGGEGAKERSQVQMALEQPEVAELVSQLKLREQYNKAVDVLKTICVFDVSEVIFNCNTLFSG